MMKEDICAECGRPRSDSEFHNFVSKPSEDELDELERVTERGDAV